MQKKELLQRLNRALRDTSTESILLHQAIADAVGLHITDHKCMDFLGQFGPMTAGRLAELTGLTTGAITGVVDRLEKAGCVRRSGDPRDRRATIIEPIPNSEVYKRLVQLFQPLAERMESAASKYTNRELTFLTDFISMAVQISREVREQLRKTKSEK